MMPMRMLADHLWQCTIVWLGVWALMPLLRRNRASVRFGIWMIASLKFLVPFALLSWATARLRAGSAPAAIHAISSAATQVETPFARSGSDWWMAGSVRAPGAAPAAPGWMLALVLCGWALGAACVLVPWVRQCARLRGLVLGARFSGSVGAVPVAHTEALVEPSIFGWLRPVLLLPCGIEQRLSATQMDAVLQHELCHVRRRDNLWLALHMLVTTLFWFHPAVWLIRGELLTQRELACDEAVVAAGGSPELYAESILRVCRWYLETAPGCAAGISGAELSDRIRRILQARRAIALEPWRKGLLVGLGVVIAGLPCVAGLASMASRQQVDPSKSSLRFDVVSIHIAGDHEPFSGELTIADGLRSIASLREMVGYAYGTRTAFVFTSESWESAAKYDVTAKVAGADSADYAKLPRETQAKLLQPTLSDRFGLRLHQEDRTMGVYEMVPAKGGMKRKLNDPRDTTVHALGADGKGMNNVIEIMNHKILGYGATMDDIALVIEEFSHGAIGRPILNRTGLSAKYDFELNWDPVASGANGSAEADDPAAGGASIFTAIQEQLGLKLVSAKDSVPVFIIDSAHKPSEN